MKVRYELAHEFFADLFWNERGSLNSGLYRDIQKITQCDSITKITQRKETLYHLLYGKYKPNFIYIVGKYLLNCTK